MGIRRRHPRFAAERALTRWRTGAPVTVGLAVTLAGATASAKPAQQPEESDFIRTLGCDEETLALQEGDRLAAAGNYEAARLEFGRAWTVWRLPGVLFKRAVAEERSGHLVEAFISYGELMMMTEPDSSYMRGLADYESRDAAAVAAMRAEADRSIGVLVNRVSELELDCPAGVRITVDGRDVVARDGRMLVTAGKHVVAANVSGRTDAAHVECKAGSSRKVTLLGGAAR
jgi:hypothetical protein